MKKLLILPLTLALFMFATACTSPDAVEDTSSTDVDSNESTDSGATMSENGLPMIDPLDVTGDISIAGSSTVYPLAIELGNSFKEGGYSDELSIASVGSGGGFDRFCNGEIDISNASRAIKQKEIDACGENGRNPIEFRIGTDALAVVVSTENDFITGATVEEIAEIFTAEQWSDVNSEWPDENIERYIPGTDSGTFDYFVEAIFEENEEPILGAANTTQSEDDNQLVTGIKDSPYAVGFFGYAYYQENENVLTILEIDEVAATQESVDAAEYPLARPLYMYSTADIIAEKPQVGSFLAYSMNNVNNMINKAGYFPAGESDMQSGIDALIDALK